MSRKYTLDLMTESVHPMGGITESDIEEMVKVARTIQAKDAGCVFVWDEVVI